MTALLTRALEAFGYSAEFRQDHVRGPRGDVIIDVVGFTQAGPHDIRTSAIACFARSELADEVLLENARLIAAPFAFIDTGTGLNLFDVSNPSTAANLVEHIPVAGLESGAVQSRLAEDLAPRAIKAAKSGTRQLSLFPLDARLLEAARSRSIDSISGRLEGSFGNLVDSGMNAAAAARLAISALGCVIVRDKYGWTELSGGQLVDAALTRHGDYFGALAEAQVDEPALVSEVLENLGDGLSYSTVDARSVNSVYEKLFLTRSLRREFGIFQTDPRFASKVLAHLPVEEIPPESRFVVDPACGSGNLLLAALERLENLLPSPWGAEQSHDWLKARIYGSDLEPTAVEVARLTLLVSSLPQGNSWAVERRDALVGDAEFPQPPTIWVTNPPWRNPKGAQNEAATHFLERAIEALAEGGLLACILPARWLTSAGKQARQSRQDLASKCTMFEVWRLPRDMFAPNARTGTAVVFAKKRQLPERNSYVFRWVTASSKHRSDFLETGAVQYQSVCSGSPKAGFSDGPVEHLASPSETCIADVATVSSGLVQTGTPSTSGTEGTAFLVRGAEPPIHRAVGPGDITRLCESNPYFSASDKRIAALQASPKLLVQADRFPDNSWRARSVVDSIGVVPCGVWQAVHAPEQTVFALHALFATSVVSGFVHGRASSKRITVELIDAIPLPAEWKTGLESEFADIGRSMITTNSDLSRLIDQAEALARNAYGLSAPAADALDAIMAGYEAADGRVRIDHPVEPSMPTRTLVGEFNQSPGAVMEVGAKTVRVWVLGGPEEGFELELPANMPGWLVHPEMTFEVTTTGDFADFRFHRCAHLPDSTVLGSERPSDE